MNKETVDKALEITPKLKARIDWEGNKLNIKPTDPLIKNTKYQILIKKEAQTIYGISFDTDYVHYFTTIGHVSPSFTPGNKASGVPINRNIVINFNQPVDHTSAESLFNISPFAPGSFSWADSAMTFSPS